MLMGVYIKGMEMPKHGCDHCFLRTGNYCGRIEKDESVVEYARRNERHPDCPLVPVPPHGRLGDLDALLESKDILDDIGWPDAYLPYSTIEAAPTIIPAEPGEEGTT